MDRHTRPYRCDMPACDAPAFGDAGGLFRHQREVHKSRDGDRPITEYLCPDRRCERNTRGFPRRWNLLEHQRRIHGISRDGNDDSRVLKRVKGARPVGSRPMSPVSPGAEDQRLSLSSSSWSKISDDATASSLRAKLQELEARKTKLDDEHSKLGKDIEALKHTLRLLESGES